MDVLDYFKNRAGLRGRIRELEAALATYHAWLAKAEAERDASKRSLDEAVEHIKKLHDDLVLFHPNADVIPPANAFLARIGSGK